MSAFFDFSKLAERWSAPIVARTQIQTLSDGELKAYPKDMGRLRRHKPGEKFLKGPIPIDLLEMAANGPEKALHVALVIWFLAGMNRKVRWVSSAVPFIVGLLLLKRWN